MTTYYDEPEPVPIHSQHELNLIKHNKVWSYPLNKWKREYTDIINRCIDLKDPKPFFSWAKYITRELNRYFAFMQGKISNSYWFLQGGTDLIHKLPVKRWVMRKTFKDVENSFHKGWFFIMVPRYIPDDGNIQYKNKKPRSLMWLWNESDNRKTVNGVNPSPKKENIKFYQEETKLNTFTGLLISKQMAEDLTLENDESVKMVLDFMLELLGKVMMLPEKESDKLKKKDFQKFILRSRPAKKFFNILKKFLVLLVI